MPAAPLARLLLTVIAALVLTACANTDSRQETVRAPAFTADPATVDRDHPPALTEINFRSHGDRLNGIVYQANGAGPHPTVLLLHGFPGNEKNLDLAQSLRRAGFNVLFFHYRGAWGSEGSFSFTHVIEDVASALAMLRSRAADLRVDADRLLLVGHSMGGFAALHGAARDERVQCAAGLAAADFGSRSQAMSPEAAAGFAAYTDTLQMLAGLTGKAAIEALQRNQTAWAVTSLAEPFSGKSILLVAADQDEAVAPDPTHINMVQAFSANPEITLQHRLLSGDHSFSWSRQALIETVVGWALQCAG
jgi:pimeloyl-ACP methyl ester carboxylesterase